ncbi:hypothetical protein TSA6c_00345 [Azospirillum sp. TSA6c]|uniref:hypothetical protein n=1 Tax=Azospirillum sp. TSA6c TaxID=709813 RepID=UPI000D61F3A3|nr:hypothetical protein [Azospirillum sp. TSA6c]PWC54411.1 hypothetical protein TSA6c_00345 [Azospirillum sp. TSA6c]
MADDLTAAAPRLNIRWALLVEGTAAQLYSQRGGWRWCMIREDVKQEWRAAARGCLRRGIRTGFGHRRIAPRDLIQKDRRHAAA